MAALWIMSVQCVGAGGYVGGRWLLAASGGRRKKRSGPESDRSAARYDGSIACVDLGTG